MVGVVDAELVWVLSQHGGRGLAWVQWVVGDRAALAIGGGGQGRFALSLVAQLVRWCIGALVLVFRIRIARVGSRAGGCPALHASSNESQVL